jgi:hypothetical protein
MACFKIFRMKDNPRQSFRWQPHTSGVTNVKPRDYQEAEAAESANVYALWNALKDSRQPLDVGDVVEFESGELRIYKYVGFEEARWVLPEVKTGLEGIPPAAGAPVAAP